MNVYIITGHLGTKNNYFLFVIIVMIDSITKLCLSLLVCTNGLSYLGEETWPTLCIKATPNQSGVRDDKRNKHQLLHRRERVGTFTNLQYYECEFLITVIVITEFDGVGWNHHHSIITKISEYHHTEYHHKF